MINFDNVGGLGINYWEYLQTPIWIERRNHVLEHAKFTCHICRSSVRHGGLKEDHFGVRLKSGVLLSYSKLHKLHDSLFSDIVEWNIKLPQAEIHHIFYENVGNEKLSDLICLCSACHKKQHNGGRKQMDITKFAESEFVGVDMVRNAATKRLVLMDGGSVEIMKYEGQETEKLVFVVGFDGRTKKWTPNRDSVQNMRAAWGSDSNLWISKSVQLQIVKLRGKDALVGIPLGEETIMGVGTTAPTYKRVVEGLKN